MISRLEPAHGPLTLTSWLMRILAAVVEPPMAAVFHTWQHFLLRCLEAAQLVRDHHAGRVLAALEHLTEELLRCRLVPPAL